MGIDPSLRATGVCVRNRAGSVATYLFGGPVAVQSDGELRDRVMQIIRQLRVLVRDEGVTAAAMEGGAFSRIPNDRLAELRGAIRFALEDPEAMRGFELQVRVVPPIRARKVALGEIPYAFDRKSGKRKALGGRELKAWIVERVRRSVEVASDGAADAAVVADWLAQEIGEPSLLGASRSQPGLEV